MYQPYVLVVEVFKTHDGHAVKVFFDETSYPAPEAVLFATDIGAILREIVKQPNALVAELSLWG
jgi:hypothetical protein